MPFTKLKTLEKNYEFFYVLGKISRFFVISFQNFVLLISGLYRRIGGYSKRYYKLKKMRSSHSGERCFIVATGPSLTVQDLELIQNEFSFGMNSVCMLYGKTKWRPSFYGIQDEEVYKRMKEYLFEEPSNVWVSSNIRKKDKESVIFNVFPLNSKYNYFLYRYTNKLKVRFSSNSYAIVYDAYSITFSLIQIAVYLGFKKIYLLGCDCNQKVGQKNHFAEYGHVEEDNKLRTAADRNIYSHIKIKSFCEKKGVEIINCTRGGKLEVYQREELEKVLKNND